MELKFLHSRQCKAILMKCLMVFILFRALGSFRISVATQKVSWFITSSNCFRLPLPIEESSLNKSSTYLRTMTKKLRVSSCTMTGSSQIRKKNSGDDQYNTSRFICSYFLVWVCLDSKFAFENCHTNKVASVIRTDWNVKQLHTLWTRCSWRARSLSWRAGLRPPWCWAAAERSDSLWGDPERPRLNTTSPSPYCSSGSTYGGENRGGKEDKMLKLTNYSQVKISILVCSCLTENFHKGK